MHTMYNSNSVLQEITGSSLTFENVLLFGFIQCGRQIRNVAMAFCKLLGVSRINW